MQKAVWKVNALDCTRAQIPAASRERLGEARARERDIPPSIQVGNGTDGRIWTVYGDEGRRRRGSGDQETRPPAAVAGSVELLRLICICSGEEEDGGLPPFQLSVEIMATRAMKGVTTFKVPLHSQKIASFPSFLPFCSHLGGPLSFQTGK